MSDKFFKIVFVYTLGLILLMVAFNLNLSSSKLIKFNQDGQVFKPVYERVDIDKLRKLIEDDKLSFKEALYYKNIDTIP